MRFHPFGNRDFPKFAESEVGTFADSSKQLRLAASTRNALSSRSRSPGLLIVNLVTYLG